MSTATFVSTESMDISTQEKRRENEVLLMLWEKDSFRTSSGFQFPRVKEKLSRAFLPFYQRSVQRLSTKKEIDTEDFRPLFGSFSNLENQYDVSKPSTLSHYEVNSSIILGSYYIIRKQNEVDAFLINNIFLLRILLDAPEQIGKYFRETTKLAIEVVSDPEIFDDQELLISILTNLTPDEAFDKINQLDENWWIDTPPNVREKVSIEVEFN